MQTAIIVGLAGAGLTRDEQRFLADARPAGMQIVVFLIVLISIGLGMRHFSRSHKEARAARTNT